MSPGRAAVVTGAGSGLGAAIARALAAGGFAVTCAGRRLERVREVAESIGAEGGRADAMSLDVTDSAQVDEVVGAAAAAWGRLDVLVNNAGIFRKGEAVTLSDAEWNDTLAANLTGAFYCARAAARIMSGQEPVDGVRGHLLGINSGAGLHGYPTGSAYTASKFGLLGLSDTLRQELADRLIKVTDLVVATTVESELSNRQGVLRLPASVVGQIVHDVVVLPGRAVITRLDLGQLPAG
jgi:3-oxoacyl-[acyl-carrier protein] reductase